LEITPTTLTLILAMFALAMVAVAQLTSHRGDPLRRRILAGFLLAIIASLANFALFTSGAVMQMPAMAFVGNTIGLSAPPLLFLYGRSLMYRDFRFDLADLRHSALPVGVALYVTFGYWSRPGDRKLQILLGEDGAGFFQTPWVPLAVYLIALGYLVACLMALKRFRGGLPEYYADIEDRDLKWFSVSVTGFILMFLVSGLQTVIVEIAPGSLASRLTTAALVTFSLFHSIYFLFHALREAELESALSAPILPTGDQPDGDKYGPHRLDDESLSRLRGRLVAHMQEVKPHLEPSLTLDQLAEKLPVSARDLSQVINRSFDVTFADFVNGYRIERAQAMLLSQPAANVSEIQYACGFATKSAFYSAFKRVTGSTPTGFRKTGQESRTSDA
jgi:AraC-like DNA-binding protein